MRFAYYPGCSAKSTCKELNAVTLRVASKLGLELIELESASCTGSREIRGVNRNLFLALNARILALAERECLPVMTVCNTCTLNLLDTQKALREDPEAAAQVNKLLADEGLRYTGQTEVTHFLWVLFEEIGLDRLRALQRRQLTGIKVAAFYGCHIVRPPSHFHFVETRNARSIEMLSAALGCEAIDYSGRTECCGFHTAAGNEVTAIKLTGRHVDSAKQNGANAIVTPCPLCHTILDTFQGHMEKDIGKKLAMPILHIPQLVGLALGMTPEELELSRHMVPVHLSATSFPLVSQT